MKEPIRQKSDQENRVKKQRVVGRIYGMKYRRRGHKDRNGHKNGIKKKVGKLRGTGRNEAE